MSRETPDNEWIIKGWPVERKDFFFFHIFAVSHATVHLFSSRPPVILPAMVPGCCIQMKGSAVGLMLISTAQIFI